MALGCVFWEYLDYFNVVFCDFMLLKSYSQGEASIPPPPPPLDETLACPSEKVYEPCMMDRICMRPGAGICMGLSFLKLYIY